VRQQEAGFTLVELLVVVVILGIIGFALTNAVILGLKTTNSTADRVSGTSAVETLNSYFFEDVQSADAVTTSATSPDPNCTGIPTGSGQVLLHLTWTDTDTAPIRETATTDVFYFFDPPSGGDQNLIRVTCVTTTTTTAAGTTTVNGNPDSTILGHFGNDPAAAPPVVLSCGVTAPVASPCPDASAVTLQVQSDPAAPLNSLTADRRSL